MRKKVRQSLDEFSEKRLSNDMIDDALNDRQRDLAHQRLWTFFEDERSFSRVTNQFAYDIPDDVQNVHTVTIVTDVMIPIDRNRWDLLHWDSDESSDVQEYVGIWNRQLKLFPRPSGGAASDALNGAITATATTITVDDTSDFTRGDYYRFIIDSEVIYATGATSTTFTRCLRGREGTTAATHSDDATVTERDIVYTTHEEPQPLIQNTDRTSVPEPDILVIGAAMDLAPFVGQEDKITAFETRYERKMKELESKFLSKQTGRHGRVKTMQEMALDYTPRRGDPNRFPRSINT